MEVRRLAVPRGVGPAASRFERTHSPGTSGRSGFEDLPVPNLEFGLGQGPWRRTGFDGRSPGRVVDPAVARTDEPLGLRLVRHDALLVRARVLLGAVDVETGQPIPIPDAFLANLTSNIAGGLS